MYRLGSEADEIGVLGPFVDDRKAQALIKVTGALGDAVTA
jgi:hypothetical protein